MDRNPQQLLKLDTIPHPGDTVVEYLEHFGWHQNDLARRTVITPKTISEICNGKAPISPATALAFEPVFQRPARFWLNLQRQYDELEARKRENAKLSIWRRWARAFPLTEMRRKFGLPVGESDVHVLLDFFGVSSPEGWEAVWDAYSVAYRQTRRFRVSRESVSVWVRETERQALELETAPFDEDAVKSRIDDLRSLTRMRFDEILEEAQRIAATVGIAVVWVPELSTTGISGCARWLSDRKALIGLTLRYKTDDQMWFTFFHELGHLLLHRRRRAFVLDNSAEGLWDNIVDPGMQKYEAEANQFAADILIPPDALGDFIRVGEFSSEDIHNFAEASGIGPGIVVGRLQHEKVLKPYQGNKLKQKLRWKFESE